MSEDHSWTQDRFYSGGMNEARLSCPVQTYRCRKCRVDGVQGSLNSAPDIRGCSGTVARPKIPRVSPFEGRDNDDEETVKNGKHYQQQQRGKKNRY